MVEKRTSYRDRDTPAGDSFHVAGTLDRLWLLSMPEVYGRLSERRLNAMPYAAVYGAEGGQYQLYRDMGVTAENYGLCWKDGAHALWWLRSPCAYNSVGFNSVCGDGDWEAYIAYYDCGVSPGFCI